MGDLGTAPVYQDRKSSIGNVTLGGFSGQNCLRPWAYVSSACIAMWASGSNSLASGNQGSSSRSAKHPLCYPAQGLHWTCPIPNFVRSQLSTGKDKNVALDVAVYFYSVSRAATEGANNTAECQQCFRLPSLLPSTIGCSPRSLHVQLQLEPIA